ncbi:uncharacterized protein LOC122071314 isoform X2 [Macadamia integrifolia]|uniref:uncharacterized protein LOC122071314 isoform X2 n=1 Tax=Macadamia integrifolia TaxID=60698 RepID=UPI001C4E94AA|nr:uncharacterized protein LOC122071314 isoform X2 [Macadamia integrifolia]
MFQISKEESSVALWITPNGKKMVCDAAREFWFLLLSSLRECFGRMALFLHGRSQNCFQDQERLVLGEVKEAGRIWVITFSNCESDSTCGGYKFSGGYWRVSICSCCGYGICCTYLLTRSRKKQACLSSELPRILKEG